MAAGVTLTPALHEPVADHFREHRSDTGQDIADAWAKVGTVGVGVVTAGVLAGGLISHDHNVTHAGLRLLFSAALAGVATEGIKFVTGRERPNEDTSAWDFDPGHSDTAFPSGHTSLAFAMPTSLSDDIHKTWATVDSTAWQRESDSPECTSLSIGSATWLAARPSAFIQRSS